MFGNTIRKELLKITKESRFIVKKFQHSQGIENKKHFNFLLKVSK
jgi:hypothetical protein